MRLLDMLKTTPIWLMLPSFVVAGAIAMTVVGYTPLVFDPSLYKIGIGVGGRAQTS